jgi:DNA-binding GntR family transcriptional regulator
MPLTQGQPRGDDGGEGSRLEAIPFRTKSELVYIGLRESIVSGELAPGETLDLDALADKFQVSRMPLRQALLRLQADNLLDLRPHRRPVVAPVSEHGIEEIYAMRVVLEALLVRAAVPRLSQDELMRLESLQEQMRVAIDSNDIQGYVRCDRDFHRTLYAASTYQRALAEVDRLRDESDRYVYLYASRDTRGHASLTEHDEILAACREREPERAADLISQHVQHGADFLLEFVKASAE